MVDWLTGATSPQNGKAADQHCYCFGEVSRQACCINHRLLGLGHVKNGLGFLTDVCPRDSFLATSYERGVQGGIPGFCQSCQESTLQGKPNLKDTSRLLKSTWRSGGGTLARCLSGLHWTWKGGGHSLPTWLPPDSCKIPQLVYLSVLPSSSRRKAWSTFINQGHSLGKEAGSLTSESLLNDCVCNGWQKQ